MGPADVPGSLRNPGWYVARAVTGRPCKPDDDMKRIWKLLLPDTPFPACGVSEGSEADAVDKKEPARDSDTASPVKRATPRR